MNIDLAGHKLSWLSIQLRLDTDAATARQAWQSAGFETEHDTESGSHHLEIASYRRQGAEYDVLSRLIVSGEEDIRLLIDYSEGDGTRPNRLRSNLRKMRTILDNLAVRCTVRCSATTTYEFGDVTSLIALPFMRFPSSQFYFDEIRGVRFVRSAENGDEVDSVALDMDGQNHLHLYAMTSFDDIASARIPMIALRHLIALRAKVVEVN